jgi:MFS family permease
MSERRSVRRFRILVVGYSVSAYGNFLNLIALSLFTYATTGSAFGTGAVMALRLTAGLLMGLAAGTLVTKLDRKALMIGADVAQAVAMGALVVLPAGVPLLCAAAAVLGAGNTLFVVALRSSVPEMVGQQNRVQANGWLVTGRSLATVLGYASAGLVVGFGGFGTAFALNGLSFLVSAVVLLCLPLTTRAAGPVEQASTDATPAGRFRLRVPVALVGLGPVLLGMVMLRGSDALGSASHNVALPIFASDLRPADPAVYMSLFWASWAVGSLSAHQVVSRWAKRWSASLDERAFALGTCVMSVMFVAAFTGLPAPALVAVMLVAGLADGFTEIAYVSRLQTVPDERRGPLFGLSATAETAGFATGMVTSAAVLEVWQPLAVVALFHGVPLAACIAFLCYRARSRIHEHPRSAKSAAVSTEHR